MRRGKRKRMKEFVEEMVNEINRIKGLAEKIVGKLVNRK